MDFHHSCCNDSGVLDSSPNIALSSLFNHSQMLVHRFTSHHTTLGTNQAQIFVAQASHSTAGSDDCILSSLNHCMILPLLSIDNNKSFAVTHSGAFSTIFLKSFLVKYVLFISILNGFFASYCTGCCCGTNQTLLVGAGTLPIVNVSGDVCVNQGVQSICCALSVTNLGLSGVQICAIY
jgi:hypothetical protein